MSVGKLLSYLTLALGRLLYHLEIWGEENIPRVGPFVCICNHSSRVDFFITSLMKRARPDLYLFVAGGGFEIHPWVSWLASSLQTIPAYKGRGLAIPSMMAALQVLQRGCPILIAAEGEFRWDGRLQPLKPGAAWLALRAHVPVIVCVLTGGYDIRPRWATLPKLTGKVTVRVGKAFYLSEASGSVAKEEEIHLANRRIVAEMVGLGDH
jgi:1-acyl-sn-glycerol-3-phosphate acyltransferase